MNCPCGTTNTYENCCGKYHQGEIVPTAEALMRARYSAFVKNNIQFIGDTHIPGTTDFDMEEASNWATSSTWEKLEVIKTSQGQENQKSGVVEFKAYYQDEKQNKFIHHEIATFKKDADKWYYVDGQIVGAMPLKRATPKVGRNEPCPCGSGKKYKKCCGNV
jgi:SEC-C motif-containing protein